MATETMAAEVTQTMAAYRRISWARRAYDARRRNGNPGREHGEGRHHHDHHDRRQQGSPGVSGHWCDQRRRWQLALTDRSEEHTSELQSHHDLVCRLLLEKKK